MIKVENLFVKYGALSAVSDVSLTIPDGEAFGIIGRNGAGKTTLVETVEGLRKKTSGKISIDGIDPSDQRKREDLYRLISVQLQSTSYPDKAKVGELCKLFGSLCANPLNINELLLKFGLLEKANKIDKVLDLVSLSGYGSRMPNELSGGQKQKLSIVLALISRPKIIFLDELTTGLDVDARHELWKYLKELKKDGVTIILVTHYMDDVEMICDRIGIMHNGQLVNIGTREELTIASGLTRRVTFTCNKDVVSELNALDGVVRIDSLGDQYTVIVNHNDFPEKCVELLNKNSISYKDFVISRPTMEDVFLQLINESDRGERNA